MDDGTSYFTEKEILNGGDDIFMAQIEKYVKAKDCNGLELVYYRIYLLSSNKDGRLVKKFETEDQAHQEIKRLLPHLKLSKDNPNLYEDR